VRNQFIDSHLSRETTPGTTPAKAPANIDIQYQLRTDQDHRHASLVTHDMFDLDLKFAFRQLKKHPGFTGVAVLTLALGIGANAVVLSWIRATLIDSIPGATDPGRLVVVAPRHVSAGLNDTMSLADIEALRGASNVFSRIAGSQIEALPVRIGRDIEWVWGQPVEADFFEVVGVQPVIGRTFLPGEDEPGATEAVAVISHRLWERRFGGDHQVIGKDIEVNERAVTIVGVAAPGFRGTMGGLDLDLWIPLSAHVEAADLRSRQESQGWRWLHTVARLRDGVSIDEAGSAAKVVGRRLAGEFPNSNRDTTFEVLPVWKAPWGGQEVFLPLLRVLTAVVVLLLALVTANMANLLLARAQQRESEVAVRAALGAGPGRIIRQFLTESLVLAALGGLGGVLLASAGKGLLLRMIPPSYLPIAYEFRIDGVMLLAICGITLLTGLLFGLMPAIRAVRWNLHETLKAGGRSMVGPSSRHWLRRGLVVGETALACVLLLGMGLCVRSFLTARQIDVGLDPNNIWLTGFRVSPESGDGVWVNGLFRRLREEAARLPGVESVALADWLPLGFEDGSGTSVGIPGYQPQAGEGMGSRLGFVSPGYFDTMRIPISTGRDFRDGDELAGPRVAVVNQAFADRFFAGRDPVGLKFVFWGAEARIIGVVETGKYQALNEPPQPFIYALAETIAHRNLTLVARTCGEPSTVARSIESLAISIDPQLTPFASLSYRNYMAAALTIPRMAAVLLTALGVVALGLAALGTYAVSAQAVERRRREMGVRLALGARPRDILNLVLKQGFVIAALGVAIGLVSGVGVARALSGVLVGVRATDLVAWAVPPTLMLVVALVACWAPARRAARVGPMEALKSE
jgi:predicted permease